MYKFIAVTFIFAVCSSPCVHGQSSANANANTRTSAAGAFASEIHTLNPIVIDQYGYQIGVPLLAPNVGALTLLNAAPLPPRSFIGQSKPVLIRRGLTDRFIGESSLGMLAI